ncbi:MAG: hypothetical protein VKN72_10890 [Nostocales cyanobacterium 94392]|nr:hypothetical protein [Nostocales cyanobacterium 94392]
MNTTITIPFQLTAKDISSDFKLTEIKTAETRSDAEERGFIEMNRINKGEW